jgi:hypothetical protein
MYLQIEMREETSISRQNWLSYFGTEGNTKFDKSELASKGKIFGM